MKKLKVSNQKLKNLKNITSYDGEDGLIENIFNTIGTSNKWCVELGALDGFYDSNSWNIIKNENWSAVLIEENELYAKRISDRHDGNLKVHVIPAFVSFGGEKTLDNILSKTSIPQDFDLLVLDIDGNDYHVWDSLKKYTPRVVSVEFNFTIPNEIDFTQPRDMGVQQGSSLRALIRLAKSKGYELVATTTANGFFVQKKLYPKFLMDDNSIDKLHTDTRYQTKMYQLYDGTIVYDGYMRLFWHKKDFCDEDLQLLPKRRRRYPAQIAKSYFLRSFKNRLRLMKIYPILLRIKNYIISSLVGK